MTATEPALAPSLRSGQAESLERDTALLQSLLGDVLEEQEGRSFRDRVFWLRDMAARVRQGDVAAAKPLVGFVGGQSASRLEPFVRACSMQLQLANVAEELERLRRRRDYDSETSVAQPESLASIRGLLSQHPSADVARALAGLDVRLVMTAHPTEVMRRSVFNHQQAVWRAMERHGDPRIGRGQRRILEDELREVLTLWWQTEAVRRLRPLVEDEVRRVLFFFEAVLFDAAPWLEAEVARALEQPWPPERPVLRFGSWAGGDMDGNPEVTPDSVQRTLELHRTAAVRLLRRRVDALAADFSQPSDGCWSPPSSSPRSPPMPPRCRTWRSASPTSTSRSGASSPTSRPDCRQLRAGGSTPTPPPANSSTNSS